MKERKTDKVLLEQYHDPENPASYGGVSRFAKSQGISLKRAKAVLGNDLGYTLHKPRRRKFPTLPVKVFTMDEQWTGDLIEVINISKQNKGFKSVSMRKPGRTRQQVIQLKSPILLKLGMNVGFGEQMIMPRT